MEPPHWNTITTAQERKALEFVRASPPNQDPYRAGFNSEFQPLGVSFATVNRWENGWTAPSKLALRQIDLL